MSTPGNTKSGENAEHSRTLFGFLRLKSLENNKEYDQISRIAGDESEHPQTREEAVKILMNKGNNTEDEWNNLFRLNNLLLRNKYPSFPMKNDSYLMSNLALNVKEYQKINKIPQRKRVEWLMEQIKAGQFDSYGGQSIVVYNSKSTGEFCYFFAYPGTEAAAVGYKYIGDGWEFFSWTLPSTPNEPMMRFGW